MVDNYIDPVLLTYLLVSVPSILTFRHFSWYQHIHPLEKSSTQNDVLDLKGISGIAVNNKNYQIKTFGVGVRCPDTPSTIKKIPREGEL